MFISLANCEAEKPFTAFVVGPTSSKIQVITLSYMGLYACPVFIKN